MRDRSAACLLRDISVLRREVIPFLIRTVMNPLMFVFVFTYLFPKMGQGFQSSAGASFGTLILPGLLAVGIFIQGIMATALAAVDGDRRHPRNPRPRDVAAAGDLGGHREDRLQRGAEHAGGAGDFPAGVLHPRDPVQVHVSSWATLIGILVLASLVAGTVGLAIGTVVKPEHIALMFGIIVVPVTFFGCVYYPWAAMYNVRWLQILVLINPLVYMSEGLRTALTPGSRTCPPGWRSSRC